MGQIKAPIAGNSKAIDKIGNAEFAHFNKQVLIHALIRGSLGDTDLAIELYTLFT
jgi:hypothetical protein